MFFFALINVLAHHLAEKEVFIRYSIIPVFHYSSSSTA